MSHKRAAVGRADVLRIVIATPDRQSTILETLAACVGAEVVRPDTPPEHDEKPPHPPSRRTEPPPPIVPIIIPKPQELQPVPQWRLASRTRLATEEAIQVSNLGPGLSDDDLSPKASTCHIPPLFDRGTLLRKSRTLLSRFEEIGGPDLRAAVQRIAKGQSLDRLPQRRKLKWPQTLWIVEDRPERLVPIFDDQSEVAPRLRKLILKEGVSCTPFAYGIHERHFGRGPKQVRDGGDTVLVLSDFGVLGDGATERLWFKWVRLQKRRGHRVVAFVPLPQEQWPRWLRGCVEAVVWDREARTLIPPDSVPLKLEGIADSKALALLTLASFALRVDPAFLRALRLCTSFGWDIGTELRAWNLMAGQHASGATWDQGRAAELRLRFLEWIRATPTPEHLALVKRIMSELKRVRQTSCPLVWDEEVLTLWNSLPESLRTSVLNQRDIEEARLRFQRACRSMQDPDETAADPAAVRQWAERIGERVGDLTRNDSAVKSLVLRARSAEEAPSDASAPRLALGLLPTGLRLEPVFGGEPGHFSLGQFESASPAVEIVPAIPHEPRRNPRATGSGIQHLGLPAGERLVLESERERLEFERLVRPKWATALGRDAKGLFLDVGEKIETLKFRWVLPELPSEVGQSVAGAWVLEKERAPTWIDRAGVDEYGAFADHDVGEIAYRFRWIAPAHFRMGSPESEWGRFEDEFEHDVELSEGYWLGEKPVTQEAYFSVTGEKPSRFQGTLLPVENVSWSQARDFAIRLNAQDASLAARLPTEAEWEFACRGGQEPKQATYAGNLDEGSAREILNPIAWYSDNSESRTHPVGEKKRNPFGLYDMLGNVWEWCEDWFASYDEHSMVDPRGPDGGAARVLRGGSWLSPARFLRAARRFGVEPSDRYDGIGFRLARSQGASSWHSHSRTKDDGPEGRRSGGGAEAMRPGGPTSGPRQKRRKR